MTYLKDKDIFGKQLMQFVRDRSITRFNSILVGELKSKECMELSEELEFYSEEQKRFIKKLVTKSIDNTVFNFLSMLELESDEMSLIVRNENGNDINVIEVSDGLSGELFTEDGWISNFSKYSE